MDTRKRGRFWTIAKREYQKSVHCHFENERELYNTDSEMIFLHLRESVL